MRSPSEARPARPRRWRAPAAAPIAPAKPGCCRPSSAGRTWWVASATPMGPHRRRRAKFSTGTVSTLATRRAWRAASTLYTPVAMRSPARWLPVGALTLAAVLVFWLFDALPFQDLPAHAGLIALRHRFPSSPFEQRFFVRGAPPRPLLAVSLSRRALRRPARAHRRDPRDRDASRGRDAARALLGAAATPRRSLDDGGVLRSRARLRVHDAPRLRQLSSRRRGPRLRADGLARADGARPTSDRPRPRSSRSRRRCSDHASCSRTGTRSSSFSASPASAPWPPAGDGGASCALRALFPGVALAAWVTWRERAGTVPAGSVPLPHAAFARALPGAPRQAEPPHHADAPHAHGDRRCGRSVRVGHPRDGRRGHGAFAGRTLRPGHGDGDRGGPRARVGGA